MNVLTDSIRADREYCELLTTIAKNFDSKPLPCVAGGLCEGAQDALCLALCEDTQSVTLMRISDIDYPPKIDVLKFSLPRT